MEIQIQIGTKRGLILGHAQHGQKAQLILWDKEKVERPAQGLRLN
jgi:hypothetical protein